MLQGLESICYHPAHARLGVSGSGARHCRRDRRGGSKPVTLTKGLALASRYELSEFLAGAERRAYKQALYAVRDDEAALDIVQDTMMKLSEK